jgi:NADH:ubiquinone oxidoreductase subunit C
MIIRKIMKQRDWLFDLTAALVFNRQHYIKYTQKRNYKNTTMVHLNWIQRYNWVFWKKHSAMGSMVHLDVVTYQNNHNPLISTVGFSNGEKIVTNLFYIPIRNKYLHVIVPESSNQFGLADLWPGSAFYLREASEMIGLRFINLHDTRRLLLDYSSFLNPLKKSLSPAGLEFTTGLTGPHNVLTHNVTSPLL